MSSPLDDEKGSLGRLGRKPYCSGFEFKVEMAFLIPVLDPKARMSVAKQYGNGRSRSPQAVQKDGRSEGQAATQTQPKYKSKENIDKWLETWTLGREGPRDGTRRA